jgi:hypothetical protein
MAQDMLYDIIDNLYKWMNHGKQGHPREEEDLEYFDSIWFTLYSLIRRIERMEEPDEEERDILNYLNYEGQLYRIHKRFDINDKNYGIWESDHFQSWSKTNQYRNFYWMNETGECILISAHTNDEYFGIDLIGFRDYVRKYYHPEYRFNSPAIDKEQEVVFPVKLHLIDKIETVNGR